MLYFTDKNQGHIGKKQKVHTLLSYKYSATVKGMIIIHEYTLYEVFAIVFFSLAEPMVEDNLSARLPVISSFSG